MSDCRIFALSDPHLSFYRPKPMNVFGPLWDNHADRIAANWRDRVAEEDIILVPGDLSWAMRLPEALPDLEWLAALPGRKVLLRGNHDYWWASPRKLRDLGLPGMYFIQNDHVALDGVVIGGSRLWDFPFVSWSVSGTGGGERNGAGSGKPAKGTGQKIEDPEKIRARELERLAASLGGMPAGAGPRIAMTHYPPLGEDGLPTPITDIIGGFGIDVCVFGHIHAPSAVRRPGEDAIVGGTRYLLTSCDFLEFAPLLLGTAASLL